MRTILGTFELLLVVTALAHILITPYTKVEESFSLHALQDVLSLGFKPPVLHLYDHVEFPGAVPRSFIGPMLLSAFTWPLLALGSIMGLWTTGLRVQLLIRSVLAGLGCTSLIFLSRRVNVSFGPAIARYTLLITTSQFHLLFWLGRTLPNMFAFPLVQVAVGLLIAPKGRKTKKGRGSHVEVLVALGILTFSALVLRLELMALLLPFALESWMSGSSKLRELVVVGSAVGAGSIALTVGIDSYFWGRQLWPEGSAILFNVVGGHASDWGVSPWHYYFTNSIPRLLHFTFPLAVFSMLVDRRSRRIGYPALAFVAALSGLGHKEWRFFVYVIPVFTVCGAAGIHALNGLFSKGHRVKALVLIVGTNLLLGSLALYASIDNYPGGVALSHISTLHTDSQPRSIHVDSHSAMTGASKFHHPFSSPPWFSPPLPSSSTWTYSRSESLSIPSGDYESFDYLITGSPTPHLENFESIHVVEGFKKFQIVVPSAGEWSPIQRRMESSVWTLRKKQAQLQGDGGYTE